MSQYSRLASEDPDPLPPYSTVDTYSRSNSYQQQSPQMSQVTASTTTTTTTPPLGSFSSSSSSGSVVNTTSNRQGSIMSNAGSRSGSGIWPMRGASYSYNHIDDNGANSSLLHYNNNSSTSFSSSSSIYNYNNNNNNNNTLYRSSLYMPNGNSPLPSSLSSPIPPPSFSSSPSSSVPGSIYVTRRTDSCCASFGKFLILPFSYHTWIVILSLILFSVPFCVLVFVANVSTFVMFSVLMLIFPLTFLLILPLIYCWRALAIGQLMNLLFLYKHAGGSERVIDKVSNSFPNVVVGDASSEGSGYCLRLWGLFKTAIRRSSTWKMLFYTVIIAPLCNILSLVFLALLIGVPLILIFNFIIVLNCTSDCWNSISEHDWGAAYDYSWIFTETKGSAVTIPVGLVLYILFANAFVRVIRGFSRIGFSLLGESIPHDQVFLLSNGNNNAPTLPPYGASSH